MNKLIITIAIAIFVISLFSCGGQRKDGKQQAGETIAEPVPTPEFNADSAYYFVQKQVDFGARVPNSSAHIACGLWLTQKLKEYSSDVIVQEMKIRAYNGTLLNGKNIIASFNPEKQKRVLLCAHWDTRPFADHDPNPKYHYKPIDGANDGGSGVGVLLEIARLLSITKPMVGIDIIFFDLEDYGEHQSLQGKNSDSWCLGSQYWSRNPHKAGYYANYGILLDMVGAKGAGFTMEGTSMFYAPDIMKKVWSIANRIGFGDIFLYQKTAEITDDHLYINKIIGIPTINIIDYENSGFFEFWHTMNDRMENISPYSLKAAGQTVLQVIFEEK